VFDVRTLSPIDDGWEERDAGMIIAAGCRSSSSGTEGKSREHVWHVGTLAQAVRLRKALEKVPGVRATINEHRSEVPD
jgi:Ser-tRNA(Ala) deacylase AlaX